MANTKQIQQIITFLSAYPPDVAELEGRKRKQATFR